MPVLLPRFRVYLLALADGLKEIDAREIPRLAPSHGTCVLAGWLLLILRCFHELSKACPLSSAALKLCRVLLETAGAILGECEKIQFCQAIHQARVKIVW